MKFIRTAIVGALCAAACTPQTPRVELHMESPVDVAFVCKVSGEPAALEDCQDKKGTLTGFVVNADRGNVSLVNLRTREFSDTDAFIPGVTSKPVGTRPVTVISSSDGSTIYTANTASKTLSSLDTTTLARTDQVIPGVPTALIEAGDELLVALPNEHQLVRIPKAEFGALKVFDSIEFADGNPYDVAVNSTSTTAYVTHAESPWLSVVDLSTGAEIQKISTTDTCGPFPLVDGCEQTVPVEVVELTGAAVADLPQCLNGIDDDGDGNIDASDPQCLEPTGAIESAAPQPLLSKVAIGSNDVWAYVTNVRDRLIVVVNLESGERVNVNSVDSGESNALYARLGYQDIVLDNPPVDIALVDVDVVDSSGVTHSRQRAYFSMTNGQVGVIEVQDPDGKAVHRLLDAQSSADSKLEVPQLFDGKTQLELSSNRRADKPSFGEFLVNKPVDVNDAAAGTTNYGIRMLGNERLELREQWKITHEGVILDRQNPLGKVEDDGVFATPEPAFCAGGVEVGDQLVIRFPGGYKNEKCPDYQGDAFAWEVKTVAQHRLTLSDKGVVYSGEEQPTTSGTVIGGLSVECFGFDTLEKYLNYEIRVPKGQYAVVGSKSGFMHGWQATDTGACELSADADPRFIGRAKEWMPVDADAAPPACPLSDDLASDYFEGQYFRNHAFEFRMLPGCMVDELTGEVSLISTAPDVSWRFIVASAFVPKRIGGMGLPSSIRFLSIDKTVYIVDSGQEKIVEIATGSDTIRNTIF